MHLDTFDWPKQLSKANIASLEHIRTRAAAIVEKQVLAHYTDHSLGHLDRVAQMFLRIAVHNLESERKLSETELFCGLAACFLHDVALQSTLGDNLPPLGELRPEHYDTIRRRHGRAAAHWIRESANPNRKESLESMGIPDVGINHSEFSRLVAPIVAALCEWHTGPEEEVPVLEDRKLANQTVRVSLLLWMVRIADALDYDFRRVNMAEMDQRRLTVESQVHWWQHHYTDSVDVDQRGKIVVTMSFHPDLSKPHIDFFRERVGQYLQRHILPASDILAENEIFLRVAPIHASTNFGGSKRKPPPELDQLITSKTNPNSVLLGHGPPPGDSEQSLGWRYFKVWGIEGNPWTDLPISYKDDEFVLTGDIRRKMEDLSWMARGERGELKMLFGVRGSGKTSFFHNVRDSYRDTNPIFLIDVVRVGGSADTPLKLVNSIFKAIFAELTSEPPPAEFSPSHLETALVRHGSRKPIILLDNLDRYSSEPAVELVMRFLGLSQGHFQALKTNSLLLISATAEWKKDLTDSNLNYIGQVSFWDLREFGPNDVKDLMSRRLVIAGSSYERVFSPEAASLVQRISEGIPRRVLHTCQFLCEKALADGVPLIDGKFIRDQFGKDLENRLAARLIQMSREDEDHRVALATIHAFLLGAQRKPHIEDLAWQHFQSMVAGELVHRNVQEELQPVIGNVGTITIAQEGVNSGEKVWVTSKKVLRFLRALSLSGTTVSDFVAGYRAKPVIWQADVAVHPEMALARFPTPAKEYFLQGIRICKEITPQTAPAHALAKAQLACESLVGGFLQARRIELPSSYGRIDEEGFTTDRYGKRVRKFAVRFVGDLDQLTKILHDRHPWLRCWPELRLVQSKTRAFYNESGAVGITSNDTLVVRSCLDQVATTLLEELKRY